MTPLGTSSPNARIRGAEKNGIPWWKALTRGFGKAAGSSVSLSRLLFAHAPIIFFGGAWPSSPTSSCVKGPNFANRHELREYGMTTWDSMSGLSLGMINNAGPGQAIAVALQVSL
jgi:hypothetical protein